MPRVPSLALVAHERRARAAERLHRRGLREIVRADVGT